MRDFVVNSAKRLFYLASLVAIAGLFALRPTAHSSSAAGSSNFSSHQAPSSNATRDVHPDGVIYISEDQVAQFLPAGGTL